MKKCFSGKYGIITGGSKGIGLATSARLFSLGANLCVVARDKNALDAARIEIEKKRIHADQILETISCDTCDQELLVKHFNKLAECWRNPDYLINCVGYARPGYVEELSLSDYRNQMEVNYYGQLVPILALLPGMLKAGKGHIVNISSMLGFMGFMGYAAYCPSKFAVVGLTDALRSELSHRGIRFSVVLPPDVDTPGFAEENRTKPLECVEMSKRAGVLNADAVAEAIVVGIYRQRNEITMGEAKLVHWLYRYFPWLVRTIISMDYRKARASIAIK